MREGEKEGRREGRREMNKLTKEKKRDTGSKQASKIIFEARREGAQSGSPEVRDSRVFILALITNSLSSTFFLCQ